MTRKQFFGGATAFAAIGLAGVDAARAAGLAKGRAKLVFGAVSDVHIHGAGAGRGDASYLRKAFAYYRDRGADGVVIAGDMADTGRLSELMQVGEAWNAVFPDNRGLGGKRVEKLFVYGNHDREGYDWARRRRTRTDRLADDLAASWRKAFGEDYDEIRIKEVNGYRFVLNNLLEYPQSGPYADFLARNRRFLTGSRPFFYVQHYHPRGTCSAPWTWGQDNGRATAALGEFPNAVAFSGHSHTPLSDERTVWQGAFTSVGTASLRYLIPFGGRENARVFGSRGDAAREAQMPFLTCADGKHGQLVSVYDDCLVIERRDFQYDLPLAADWVIPLPFDGSYAFAPRALKATVPEFASGAKVTVSHRLGRNRAGMKTEQTGVAFPNVLKGVRAFDYEVAVECEDVDTVKTLAVKRVYSPGFYRAAEKDIAEVTCAFAPSELAVPRYTDGSGKGPLKGQFGSRWRFAVRPCNCFGAKGRAIYSPWQGNPM